MLRSPRFKPLLGITRIPFPSPKVNPFVSTLSSKYCSTTSEQNSFTFSYLVTNRGFSPQDARKASKLVRFDTAAKPDSVIAFFRNHGFSDFQINSTVRHAPNLLTCNPSKRVLSKFEFLRSEGASRIIPRAFVVQYLISKGLIEKNDELSTPFSVF